MSENLVSENLVSEKSPMLGRIYSVLEGCIVLYAYVFFGISSVFFTYILTVYGSFNLAPIMPGGLRVQINSFRLLVEFEGI